LADSSIYLVSCVAKKLARPSAARDLYISDWFLKARRFVEATGRPWFILSAEHGLLSPDQIIAPYERTLNKMAVADRRAWADRTHRQLQAQVPTLETATIFAGQRYRGYLVPNLVNHGVVITVPMAGLAIGQQLSWLKLHQPHRN